MALALVHWRPVPMHVSLFLATSTGAAGRAQGRRMGAPGQGMEPFAAPDRRTATPENAEKGALTSWHNQLSAVRNRDSVIG